MSNGIMDNPGDAKYGFTHEQIIEGFKILKEKGAKHFGVHAFLASNTVTNEYYPKLARELFELVVELRDKTGCDIRFYQSLRRCRYSVHTGSDAERHPCHRRGRPGGI